MTLIFPLFQVTAQKYWIYDGDSQFTPDELYMMENCGTCTKYKHFEPISNPPGISVLSDEFAKNNKCAEMFFPGCQYSTTENFCMKTMSQPESQIQFPFGTDIYQAFSVFVPMEYNHDSAVVKYGCVMPKIIFPQKL